MAIRNVYAFYSQRRGLISIKQIRAATLPSSWLPSMAIRNAYAFYSPLRGLISTRQVATAPLPSPRLPARAIRNAQTSSAPQAQLLNSSEWALTRSSITPHSMLPRVMEKMNKFAVFWRLGRMSIGQTRLKAKILPSSSLPPWAIRNVYAFYSQRRELTSTWQMTLSGLPSSWLPTRAIRNVYAFYSQRRGLISIKQLSTATLPSSPLPTRAIRNV